MCLLLLDKILRAQSWLRTSTHMCTRMRSHTRSRTGAPQTSAHTRALHHLIFGAEEALKSLPVEF